MSVNISIFAIKTTMCQLYVVLKTILISVFLDLTVK